MHSRPSGSGTRRVVHLTARPALNRSGSEAEKQEGALPVKAGSLPAFGLPAERDGAPLRRKPGFAPFGGGRAWVSEEEESPLGANERCQWQLGVAPAAGCQGAYLLRALYMECLNDLLKGRHCAWAYENLCVGSQWAYEGLPTYSTRFEPAVSGCLFGN